MGKYVIFMLAYWSYSSASFSIKLFAYLGLLDFLSKKLFVLWGDHWIAVLYFRYFQKLLTFSYWRLNNPYGTVFLLSGIVSTVYIRRLA